jgi:putative transposase
MPTGLVRFQQTGHFHFLTFSCYKRQPFLRTAEAKDWVLQFLEQTRHQQGLRIAAYVLMPEHVYLLTNEPNVGTLATFLQVFKQLTSRQLKTSLQKQFWQRRYYDFNVSTSQKYVEKLRYIHRNPVNQA